LTFNENGTFTTKLPRTNLNITFRLLTGADEKFILTQMENARKRNRPEQNITLQLKSMITAVEDNGTNEAIDYLINNIPSLDARHLRLAYKVASPNIDLTQHFSCKECDHEQTMEVPLTADFFWPDR